MKRAFLLYSMGISLLMGGSFKTCIEYNPSDFILEEYIYYGSSKSAKMNIADLEELKIYYHYDKDKLIGGDVAYKANGHQFIFPYLYCEKREGEKHYGCGVDCDGGYYRMNDDFSIIGNGKLSVYDDDGATDELVGGAKILSQKNPETLSKGKRIQCPSDIPDPDYYEKSSYTDNPKGLYVCYGSRHEGEYFDCFRSVQPCKSIRSRYFGQYPNRSASRKALHRCKRSKPNKKFIDNKNGRYVCYDYADLYGIYAGCFRSTLGCKSIGKKRFGRYDTQQEADKALFRCISSAPKKPKKQK